MDAARIRGLLTADAICKDIVTLETTGSTNADAAALADGKSDNFAVLADRQTAGRGRLGRTFSSEEGGLYLSVCVKRPPPAEYLSLVTPYAAVAVRRAVMAVCGAQPCIKWVNDLLLDSRKLCGILCTSDSEGGEFRRLIIGIGLNVGQRSFAPPVDKIATSLALEGFAADREALAAAILNALTGVCDPTALKAALGEYRAASAILGKPVTVCSDPPRVCTAEAIDDSGGLVLREADGRVTRLAAGEISVRPII